jgi:translation elongation factor EF-Tu-like GTPase
MHDLARFDIEAELMLFPTEQGGRHGSLLSGFRGAHFILDEIHWVAEYVLTDRDQLSPGDTAPVLVRFFGPEGLVGRLWVGREFAIDEGGKHIGHGTISGILNFDEHVAEGRRSHPQEKRQRPRKGRGGSKR